MSLPSRRSETTWILLDADGVLQSPATPFLPALEHLAGPTASTWLEQTFRPDGPVITGRQEVLPLLREYLTGAGVSTDPREVYESVWKGIRVHDDVLALVGRWRSSGYRVALTTNQDPGRAQFMKTTLGFDQRFDRSFYSCDLGVGKPSARYFESVLESLQVQPSQVFFIDDSESNVRAARALGINSLRWEYGADLATLVVPAR